MTTNKPEVFYATNLYSSAPVACLMRRTGEKAEPVIRLSDYEALQAECEKLGEDLDKTELRALKFIHQCNAHVELYRELKDERDQLRAECEKLRKDADRWREIRKGGDSVRVVFTDWDAMKDYVLSNEEADAAIDAAMEPPK